MAFRSMELGGLEPPASCMPCRRSGQLSYSPFEFEVLCKVNACPLGIPGWCQPEADLPHAGDETNG